MGTEALTPSIAPTTVVGSTTDAGVALTVSVTIGRLAMSEAGRASVVKFRLADFNTTSPAVLADVTARDSCSTAASSESDAVEGGGLGRPSLIVPPPPSSWSSPPSVCSRCCSSWTTPWAL